MRYYIIAGEASGDLHGSNLMSALKKKDPNADFRFFGGDLMSSEGGVLVRHYKEMAFMGIFDVIFNLKTIFKNLIFCKNDLLNYSPDVLILIDYPGFNLRIAKFASGNNIRVFYYISPKVWAWKKGRIKQMKKYISKLFVIFPFEVEYFKSFSLNAEFYGNPLKDAIYVHRKNSVEGQSAISDITTGKSVIALLAGSRISEVKLCLPDMVKAASFFPEYRFIVAGVSSIDKKIYESILSGTNIELITNKTYELLDCSYAAIVTSGTATLETALFNVPQVVIYKAGPLTYFIGRFFVKVRFFSLVNIIAGKEVVKELLQNDLVDRIKEEMSKLLNDKKYRDVMMNEYQKISFSLGEASVSERLASRIYELLN